MLTKTLDRVQVSNTLPVQVARAEGFTPAHFAVESGLMWLYMESPGPVGRMWVQAFRHAPGAAVPASAEYLGTTHQGAMVWHLYDVTRLIHEAAADDAVWSDYVALMKWSVKQATEVRALVPKPGVEAVPAPVSFPVREDGPPATPPRARPGRGPAPTPPQAPESEWPPSRRGVVEAEGSNAVE